MPFVHDSGAAVYYEVAGAGAPGFLLVPGWACDVSTMAPLADHVAHHHRVAILDLRGHGRSGLDGPYSAADVVADLVAVAHAATLPRHFLIGHSLGAKFVLEAARLRPETIRGIVLLDTSIAETAERKRLRLAEVDAAVDDTVRRRRIERMFASSDPVDFRARTLRLMLGTSAAAMRAALLAGDPIDTAGALRDCPVPALYIGASRPAEDPALLRELRPNLYYGQVVGSGHFVQLTATDQVAAMIDRFVELVA